MENSCLMLMMSLYAPVDLDFVISEEDLAVDGIENNTHITAFYADTYVPKENLIPDIQEFLGLQDYESFLEFLKKDKTFPVYDTLGLDKFENPDYDVLILRLKEGTKVYDLLEKINSGFVSKYSLTSDFGSYKPHLTLAYLRPGMADSYLGNATLGKVLDDSRISYDDLMVSYKTKDSEKYREWWLTHYWCIPRHLRLQKLAKNKEKLKKEK